MMTHMHAMSKQHYLRQHPATSLSNTWYSLRSNTWHAEMDNDEWYSLLVTNITPCKRMYSALVCCGVWCSLVQGGVVRYYVVRCVAVFGVI